MFEHHLKPALNANATIASEIGSRFAPINLAQGTRRPYLAWSITDREDPSPTHSGPSGFTKVTFDLLTVAESYAECASLSEATRQALGNYSGTAAGTTVHWTKYDSETDIEQQAEPGSETPIYVRQQTYRALYN